MRKIFSAFPGLQKDNEFKVTSPIDHRYNCIAWSAVKNNIFWWPLKDKLDGAEWPFNLPEDESLETFTKLYEIMEYEVCQDCNFEDGFQKIAIYINPSTDTVTHASRQQINGFWTSKLGKSEDIQHRDPYSLEGDAYGRVVRIMRRPNSSFTSPKPSKKRK